MSSRAEIEVDGQRRGEERWLGVGMHGLDRHLAGLAPLDDLAEYNHGNGVLMWATRPVVAMKR
jgi:hypothetical protein